MLSLVFSQDEIVQFGVVLFRVAGIMTFAPFFSSRAVSYQVRIALTLAATLALQELAWLFIMINKRSLRNIRNL